MAVAAGQDSVGELRAHRTDAVRNSHARAHAAHSDGAPDCSQTSFGARLVREEGLQNEKAAFLAANKPVAG